MSRKNQTGEYGFDFSFFFILFPPSHTPLPPYTIWGNPDILNSVRAFTNTIFWDFPSPLYCHPIPPQPANNNYQPPGEVAMIASSSPNQPGEGNILNASMTVTHPSPPPFSLSKKFTLSLEEVYTFALTPLIMLKNFLEEVSTLNRLSGNFYQYCGGFYAEQKN